MSSLTTDNVPPWGDFEQETRRIIGTLKKVRRWRSSHEPDFMARLRRRLAVIFAWIAGIFMGISRCVDSWKATHENVLEHSFKQTLLVIRMLIIEKANGNLNKLNFFRVLCWPAIHDMAEGDPRSEGDINYWVKRKSKETEKASRDLEGEILRDLMDKLFSPRHRNFHPKNLDIDSVPEQEKIFWSAAEKISHCLFMLEEVTIGRISRARQLRFYNNVNDKLVKWLKENAWQFASVREIVEKEIMPKWDEVGHLVLRSY